MNSNLYAETFQHILALIFVSNLWVIEAQIQLLICLDTVLLAFTH